LETSQPQVDRDTALLSARWYRNYVLGVLFLAYVINVVHRSPVLGVALQSIKDEFGVSDTLLGLLSGITFAVFYSAMGVPIAAWADRTSRRKVLALAVALWSGMTALFGGAVNFTMLLLARVGVAVGQAGGSPPSHSLISDYFPRTERGRAFSIFALGVPIGTALGNYVGGQTVQAFGWRTAFVLVAIPGVLVALLLRLTIKEPPRGFVDGVDSSATRTQAPGMLEALATLWQRRSFRHLSLAVALHSVAWYARGAFNAAFLIRSHQLTAGQAGNWLTVFSIVGAFGTFFGGTASDRLSVRTNDKRWYMWLPGLASLFMVPFQFGAYLLPGDVYATFGSIPIPLAFLSFAIMSFLAAVFFGPSFAMTQALAPLRMRSVATSLLLFVQTIIGLGVGPIMVGRVSDWLMPGYGADSLRYAIVIVGMTGLWAAVHYMLGARHLRGELARAEAAAEGR
jgi:MFS family permease